MSIYSICVRDEHEIKICPTTRNSLFWTLRKAISGFGKGNEAFVITDQHIHFKDNYPLHDLTDGEVFALIRGRGFFTVGLQFVHPDTNCLWQGMVQFNGVASQEYYRNRGQCYEGFAGDLRICLEQSLVPKIESQDFYNTVEGKRVKFHVYTPVCFDAKQ